MASPQHLNAESPHAVFGAGGRHENKFSPVFGGLALSQAAESVALVFFSASAAAVFNFF